eukprot:CAMPEP_0171163678 /NCGR_PEP_ID=MMETSP0790-20130122/5274_1 /TAXON_ID=2925 /ORGANISM="Alexandrium catenella, Strain OF101" /LENGTH=309 /DNA_ID=CAMNT_0011628405 /DNA_START=15 /DNA_END=944 /DNA_ORIENTATION=-
MWRLASVFIALQVASVVSASLESELAAAEHDDECLAADGAGCALNALQKRGARVAATDEAAEEFEELDELDELDDVDELEGAEELELLETEEAEESGSGRRRGGGHTASAGGDLTKHEEATESRRLRHRKKNILTVAKHLDKVEASVNQTYVMTMKELAPGKAAAPPPMPKLSTRSSGGRRRHHHASTGPPRERKVSRKIAVCEAMVKSVWARIKRSSKIMVFTEKRITGGEIGSLAVEAADDLQSPDGEEKPAADGDAAISVKSGKADLDARIKQLSKETRDANKDIKRMEKRATALRKLFKDTYTTS